MNTVQSGLRLLRSVRPRRAEPADGRHDHRRHPDRRRAARVPAPTRARPHGRGGQGMKRPPPDRGRPGGGVLAAACGDGETILNAGNEPATTVPVATLASTTRRRRSRSTPPRHHHARHDGGAHRGGDGSIAGADVGARHHAGARPPRPRPRRTAAPTTPDDLPPTTALRRRRTDHDDHAAGRAPAVPGRRPRRGRGPVELTFWHGLERRRRPVAADERVQRQPEPCA